MKDVKDYGLMFIKSEEEMKVLQKQLEDGWELYGHTFYSVHIDSVCRAIVKREQIKEEIK